MKGVLAVCAALAVAAPTSGGSERPARALTRSGKALWNFEALIHDTFGYRPVCTRRYWFPLMPNFVATPNRCAPLTVWAPYVDVFFGASHSSFHLVLRHPRGDFGNYPQPIRLGGRFVACDPAARTFLILYGNAADFALDCLPPQPPSTDIKGHPTVPARVRLTSAGVALWNFEALLRDIFGRGDVCTKGNANYVDGGCSPLATWNSWFGTFDAHRSAFRLLPNTHPVRFRQGNLPVRIRNHFIACESGERTYLAIHHDGFTCVTPR